MSEREEGFREGVEAARLQLIGRCAHSEAECERLRRDAERYEWLCADLDSEQRAKRSHIFNRMSVMGKGAIDAAIDAASAEGER